MKTTPWLRTALPLALALATLPALAQTLYTTNIQVEATHGPDQAPDSIVTDWLALEGPQAHGRQELLADSDHDAQDYNGLARAWADVRTAGIHLQARSQAVSLTTPWRTFGNAQTSGFFSDHFTLNVPSAPAGTVFVVTAQIRSEGHNEALLQLGAGAIGSSDSFFAGANWTTWGRVIGASGTLLAEVRAGHECGMRDNRPLDCAGHGSIGLATLSFEMVNGGPPVMLDLRAWVNARSVAVAHAVTGTADSLSDMGHTLAWAGVTGLHDASGALVAAPYSLLSAGSGFDYRLGYVSAVPEPASAGLLLAGVLALALRRRQR